MKQRKEAENLRAFGEESRNYGASLLRYDLAHLRESPYSLSPFEFSGSLHVAH